MSHDFWVTITGERGREWKRVAGTDYFPVLSPIPVMGDLPGIGLSRVYLLAIDQMEPNILSRIVAHLSGKFGMTAEETQAELDKGGIPILADDCMVTVLNPQKWFDD
jgi:hypothetical protein